MKLDLHILFNQVHMDNELTEKKRKRKKRELLNYRHFKQKIYAKSLLTLTNTS